jgi:hypothetical protein
MKVNPKLEKLFHSLGEATIGSFTFVQVTLTVQQNVNRRSINAVRYQGTVNFMKMVPPL